MELSAGVTKHTYANGQSHDCMISTKVTFSSIMFLLILLARNNALIIA